MEFVSKKHLKYYLKNLKFLGEGSQGICFIDRNKVIKIFHSFFDGEDCGFNKEEILGFSHIKNNTYIWPDEVITINNQIIGYTQEYKKAKNLCKFDPLTVNLNSLEKAILVAEKDILKISKASVCIYDMIYNVLYNNHKLFVIDTLEYANREVDYLKNRMNLDIEIKMFLVDNYFDYFVNSNKDLKEMYNENEVESIEFMKVFRTKLSEYYGKEIKKLDEAKSLVRKKKVPSYIRF